MPQPDLEQPEITVRLGGSGEVWTRISSYRLEADYLSPSDSWSITVYDDEDPRGLRRRFRPLLPIEIAIDGNVQIIGRIGRTEGQGRSLVVTGHDYIHDIVTADVDTTFRVTSGMDIGDFILAVCKPFGIKTVFGSWNLTRNILTGKQPFVGEPRRDFRAEKLSDLTPKPGEKVFEFLERPIARHGFMLQPAGTRDAICVTEPQFAQPASFRIVKTNDGTEGNLIDGHAERDYEEAPTVVIAVGRRGRDEPGKGVKGMRNEFMTFGLDSPAELVRQAEVQRIVTSDAGLPMLVEQRFREKESRPPYGTEFPLYRPMYYEDHDSGTQAQLERGIRRQIAEKLKNTLTYAAELRGHRDPVGRGLYAVDTVADVRDEVEDVEELMWVVGRSFANTGHGPTTSLKLMRLGAYAL